MVTFSTLDVAERRKDYGLDGEDGDAYDYVEDDGDLYYYDDDVDDVVVVSC